MADSNSSIDLTQLLAVDTFQLAVQLGDDEPQTVQYPNRLKDFIEQLQADLPGAKITLK